MLTAGRLREEVSELSRKFGSRIHYFTPPARSASRTVVTYRTPGSWLMRTRTACVSAFMRTRTR